MNLQRVQGPSCPDCGCQDSTAGRAEVRWGQTRRPQRCNHCGCRFVEIVERQEPTEQEGNGQAIEEETPQGPRATIFHVVHCPECGSDHQRVTRTLRPVRYHKCQKCSHTFKSVEKTEGDRK